MIKKIHGVVNDISVLITEIASASNEVRVNSEKQKNRTQNALDEINKMIASIKDVNKTANLVSNTAKKTTLSVKKGNEYAEKVILSINTLQSIIKEAAYKLTEAKENSQEIEDILKTIYNITDKSDLLALNAAIEAAKAGETGKGFSVVASEIRKLADKSAKSSQEIESILKGIQNGITESVDSIEKGVNEVNGSVGLTRMNEKVLDNVFCAFKKTTKLMDNVTLALNKQSSGVSSLNNTIEVISNVATEFASGAIQTNQALNNLSTLMEDLNSRFNIFKIEN
jgi:methyl-accepting chemotaxis protein